jgi:hypothetical protein
MAQTSEVIEGYHLQVWPGKNIWQLDVFTSGFASTTLKPTDGFEDADSRQFLDALGKGFLDFSGFASTNPETRFRWACSCGVGWYRVTRL